MEQDLRQGCVLAPLMFNIFFAVVINVAYTRFKADKDIMDALVHHLPQGCVLAPLLFNIFFAVVINVAYTRFKADKDIMDALVHLRK